MRPSKEAYQISPQPRTCLSAFNLPPDSFAGPAPWTERLLLPILRLSQALNDRLLLSVRLRDSLVISYNRGKGDEREREKEGNGRKKQINKGIQERGKRNHNVGITLFKAGTMSNTEKHRHMTMDWSFRKGKAEVSYCASNPIRITQFITNCSYYITIQSLASVPHQKHTVI